MHGGGRYRYYRDPSLGPQYEAAMDALFDTYAALLPRVSAWTAQQFPRRDDEPEAAHARAIKAKALDLLRGLLPAASLSHMGIFATGQTYEQLILHLLAHPLPEAQRYGRMLLQRRAVDDPVVRDARRAARPRRRVGRLPAHARGGRAPRGRRGWGSPRTRARRRAGAVGDAAARRGQRGRPARRRCCTRRAACRRSARTRRSPRSTASGAPRCCATSSARARTAATGPGAASRRCATASRSSPTTARSATCSATAC